MAPRVSAQSLLNNIEDGDVVTTETVKRVGVALFTHIHTQDLTISVGSVPDRPDGQLVSSDIFEGSIARAFRIDGGRVSKNINSLLAYVKITNHPVAICNGDPDEEDTDVIVILVVHPNFDRRIFMELTAHERRVRLQTQEMFTIIERRLDELTSTTGRLESDTGMIRQMLDEQVIPVLAER
jgi:hypothetical protein